MEKKYKVYVSVYDSVLGQTYAEEEYAEMLRGFRTKKGAMAFLKKVVRKFKTVW